MVAQTIEHTDQTVSERNHKAEWPADVPHWWVAGQPKQWLHCPFSTQTHAIL